MTKKNIVSGLLTGLIILSNAASQEINATTLYEFGVYQQTFETNISDFVCSEGIITKYIGNGGNVLIPSMINGITVTAIGWGAFSDCDNLLSVAIPNTVTTIGGFAFQNCSNLKKVTIPDSVSSIGTVHHMVYGAFTNCTQLESVGPVGSGCDIEFAWTKEIPSFAFAGLSNLKEINLPDTIVKIGEDAFSHNYPESNLVESIFLPETLTEIGVYAFGLCENLKTIFYGGSEALWSTVSMDIDSIPERITIMYHVSPPSNSVTVYTPSLHPPSTHPI